MTTIVPHIGIRISGIQSLEVAKVIIKNGGSIAFIFDQKNPKYIDPAKASKISETISKNVRTCGIFVDPSDEEIIKVGVRGLFIGNFFPWDGKKNGGGVWWRKQAAPGLLKALLWRQIGGYGEVEDTYHLLKE
jgi:hypothetical protein